MAMLERENELHDIFIASSVGIEAVVGTLGSTLANPLFSACGFEGECLSNPRFGVEYSHTSVEEAVVSRKRVQWTDIDHGQPLTQQYTVGYWDRTPYIPARRKVVKQESAVAVFALYGTLVFLGICVVIDTFVLT